MTDNTVPPTVATWGAFLEARKACLAWMFSEGKNASVIARELSMDEQQVLRIAGAVEGTLGSVNQAGSTPAPAAPAPASDTPETELPPDVVNTPQTVLMDKSLRQFAHYARIRTCSAWSAARDVTGYVSQAHCDEASAWEKRLKSAIDEIAQAYNDLYDFARKLERERNVARAIADQHNRDKNTFFNQSCTNLNRAKDAEAELAIVCEELKQYKQANGIFGAGA